MLQLPVTKMMEVHFVGKRLTINGRQTKHDYGELVDSLGESIAPTIQVISRDSPNASLNREECCRTFHLASRWKYVVFRTVCGEYLLSMEKAIEAYNDANRINPYPHSEFTVIYKSQLEGNPLPIPEELAF